MNVFVTFESQSLMQGLTRFEDTRMVRVAITLVLQWLLAQHHQRRSPEDVIEDLNQCVKETFVHAEHLLTSYNQVDHHTGQVSEVRYPTIHRESDKIYRVSEYNTSHGNWFHRYAEIVEHLVLYYTRPVLGFFQHLERDKHAVNIQCLDYTHRYIAASVFCWNLIEYQTPTS